MKNSYNYCTRCGDELPDELSEAYQEETEPIPPMCRECWTGFIEGFTTPVISALNDALEPFAQAAREMNEVLEQYVDDAE